MNYLNWNNLLSDYFFNEENENKEIFLFIDKSTIIDIGKNSEFLQEFLEEVDDHQSVNEVIWGDFCKSLKIGIGKKGNVIENACQCFKLWHDDPRPIRISGVDIIKPIYIAYLVCFILPLTENEDDYIATNYYPRLNEFLKNNQINNDVIIGTSKFSIIDKLWEDLSIWANELEKGRLGIYNVKSYGNHIYVGKPFSECVITSKQRHRLPFIFSEADLSVGEIIAEEQFLKILIDYGQECLKYSNSKWKQIINSGDLRNILLNNLINAYNVWKGRASDINDGSIEYKKSTYNAFLKLEIKSISNIALFYLKIQNPDSTNILEEYHFAFGFNKNIQLNKNGWSNDISLDNNELDELLTFGLTIEDNVNKLKAKIKQSNIILFALHYNQNAWLNNGHFKLHNKFRILFNIKEADDLIPWLIDNCSNVIKMNNYGLPKNWLLYSFDNPNLSYKQVPSMQIASSWSQINVKGIKIGRSTKNGAIIFLKDRPIQFNFEGLKGSDKVKAIFEDNEELELLLYNDELNTRLIKYSKQLINKPFRIYVNNVSNNNQSYCFTDYFIAETEPKNRDTIGRGVEEETEICGLKTTIRTQPIFKYGTLIERAIGSYKTEIDKFIYYLSTKGNISYYEFKEAFIVYNSQKEIKGYIFNRAYNLLDQLGYFDYNFNIKSRKHSIIINPPTIINLPTINSNLINLSTPKIKSQKRVMLTGARSPKLIEDITNYCNENNFIIQFKYDENTYQKYLIPQTIIIYASDYSKRTLKDLAHDLKLNYQYDVDISEALLSYSAELNDNFLNLINGEKVPFHECERQRKYIDFEELSTSAKSNQELLLQDEEYKIYKKGTVLHAKYPNKIDNLIRLFYGKLILNSKIDHELLKPELLPILVEYDPDNNIDFKRILWVLDKNGRMSAYEMDKAWGTYFVLWKREINIIKYDFINKKLWIPNEFPLPRLISRSLVLQEAEVPEEQWINGKLYHLYSVNEKIVRLLEKKLNQRIIF